MYTNTYMCVYYIYIFTLTISKSFLTTSISSSDVIKNLKRLTNLKICIFFKVERFFGAISQHRPAGSFTINFTCRCCPYTLKYIKELFGCR